MHICIPKSQVTYSWLGRNKIISLNEIYATVRAHCIIHAVNIFKFNPICTVYTYHAKEEVYTELIIFAQQWHIMLA
jgi:hypothetical protein